MSWITAIIARSSFNAGILQPAIPTGHNPTRNTNISALRTLLPSIPAPLDLPAGTHPQLFHRPVTNDPLMVALRRQIHASAATITFYGEPLHLFYGNRLIELPTPLMGSQSIRLSYQNIRDAIPIRSGGNPPLSVCLIAFGRRLFITSRPLTSLFPTRVAVLRPNHPIVIHLPPAFRDHAGGMLLSHRRAAFQNPPITLGVADGANLTHPIVDTGSPWTGFLRLERSQASPLFVRASAIEFVVDGRPRVTAIHRLPRVISVSMKDRLGAVELIESIAVPSVEWMGVFLLKNDLGRELSNKEVDDFQWDVATGGFGYRVRLHDRTLLIWCMRFERHGNGYTFAFCNIPDRHDCRGEGRMVNFTSHGVHCSGGVIGARFTEGGRGVGAQRRRMISLVSNMVVVAPGSERRTVARRRRSSSASTATSAIATLTRTMGMLINPPTARTANGSESRQRRGALTNTQDNRRAAVAATHLLEDAVATWVFARNNVDRITRTTNANTGGARATGQIWFPGTRGGAGTAGAPVARVLFDTTDTMAGVQANQAGRAPANGGAQNQGRHQGPRSTGQEVAGQTPPNGMPSHEAAPVSASRHPHASAVPHILVRVRHLPSSARARSQPGRHRQYICLELFPVPAGDRRTGHGGPGDTPLIVTPVELVQGERPPPEVARSAEGELVAVGATRRFGRLAFVGRASRACVRGLIGAVAQSLQVDGVRFESVVGAVVLFFR